MVLISYSALWNYVSSRDFLARLLSTLFCSILVVVRAFSKYGGSLSFLALTIKELHFAPQHNLAQQVENLLLNLLFGVIGIAICVLGNYLASMSHDPAFSRAIPAIFLSFMCFSAGWLKSALPRLTLSARLICFISIWMLTEDPGSKSGYLKFAEYFIWVTLTAALTSLCACLLVLHWSTAHLAQDVAAALSSLHDCLHANLESPFNCTSNVQARPSSLQSCQSGLLKKVVALDISYQQASFELRVGRIAVRSMKPLIGTVEVLRREISWGMSFPQIYHTSTSFSSAFEQTIADCFRTPAIELGGSILDSISVIRATVLKCYDVSSHEPMKLDDTVIEHARERLIAAVHEAKTELERFCDDLDKEQRTSSEESVDLPSKTFNLCLYMISLMQMANELQYALDIARKIVRMYETSSVHLYHPRLSRAWFSLCYQYLRCFMYPPDYRVHAQ